MHIVKAMRVNSKFLHGNLTASYLEYEENQFSEHLQKQGLIKSGDQVIFICSFESDPTYILDPVSIKMTAYRIDPIGLTTINLKTRQVESSY